MVYAGLQRQIEYDVIFMPHIRLIASVFLCPIVS